MASRLQIGTQVYAPIARFSRCHESLGDADAAGSAVADRISALELRSQAFRKASHFDCCCCCDECDCPLPTATTTTATVKQARFYMFVPM